MRCAKTKLVIGSEEDGHMMPASNPTVGHHGLTWPAGATWLRAKAPIIRTPLRLAR